MLIGLTYSFPNAICDTSKFSFFCILKCQTSNTDVHWQVNSGRVKFIRFGIKLIPVVLYGDPWRSIRQNHFLWITLCENDWLKEFNALAYILFLMWLDCTWSWFGLFERNVSKFMNKQIKNVTRRNGEKKSEIYWCMLHSLLTVTKFIFLMSLLEWIEPFEKC